MKPEEKLELWTVQRALGMGALAYKVQFPGHNGAPDRLFVWPDGVLQFVEFKSGTDLSETQKKLHREWLDRHAHIAVINSRAQADMWLRMNQERLAL